MPAEAAAERGVRESLRAAQRTGDVGRLAKAVASAQELAGPELGATEREQQLVPARSCLALTVERLERDLEVAHGVLVRENAERMVRRTDRILARLGQSAPRRCEQEVVRQLGRRGGSA